MLIIIYIYRFEKEDVNHDPYLAKFMNAQFRNYVLFPLEEKVDVTL